MQPSKLLVMRILAHDWKPLTDIAGALCRQLTQAHNECRLEAHMPRKILGGGGVCWYIWDAKPRAGSSANQIWDFHYLS